jgi:hypothetical protein
MFLQYKSILNGYLQSKKDTPQAHNLQYFKANSTINPWQWLRMMQHWHGKGSRSALLVTAIMAVGVATLARWDSLQNVCLGDLALEMIFVNTQINGISVVLSHLKGHHNDRFPNKTGWVRHRHVLQCATFNLALHLYL